MQPKILVKLVCKEKEYLLIFISFKISIEKKLILVLFSKALFLAIFNALLLISQASISKFKCFFIAIAIAPLPVQISIKFVYFLDNNSNIIFLNVLSNSLCT